MILLDTNAVIAVLNDKPRPVDDMLVTRMEANELIGISSIVLFELRYGVAKSSRPDKNSAKLQEFLASKIIVVPFEEDDATAAGTLRAKLASAGTPIGPYDVLIAGQALRHGATLVTANVREFERVLGLRVEDWGRI